MIINFKTKNNIVTLIRRTYFSEICWFSRVSIRQKHRKKKPAYILSSGYKSWYRNGSKYGFCWCDTKYKYKECMHPYAFKEHKTS